MANVSVVSRRDIMRMYDWVEHNQKLLSSMYKCSDQSRILWRVLQNYDAAVVMSVLHGSLIP